MNIITEKHKCDLCGKEIETTSKIKFKPGYSSKFDMETIKLTTCDECTDMIINYCQNKQMALARLDDQNETPPGVEAAAMLMIEEMFRNFKTEGMSKEDFLNFFIRDLRYVLGMGYPDDEET